MSEWIEWNGSDCPVPEGTLVDVRHRSGMEYSDVQANCLGRAYTWEHNDVSSDIIAYRLHERRVSEGDATPEYTGSSVSYYRVTIAKPTSLDLAPYTAECNDIIEALGMNYAEGNAFKAIWRSCAARNLKLAKAGYKDGLYDAEKVVFFGQRMVEQAK